MRALGRTLGPVSSLGDSLFDLEPVAPAGTEARAPMPIRDEQVDEIRTAFAAAGIDDVAARQALIESCVLRPTASLRDLYAKDVRGILERIASRGPGAHQGSVTAWADRSEDTWIDKL